jgi:3-methyladenine DNA glycosylase Tag
MAMKGIIAYGQEEDRQKLAVLATLTDQSGSQWIIEQIRERYREAFGDSDPSLIIPMK